MKAGILLMCKRMLNSISNLPNRGVRVVTLQYQSKEEREERKENTKTRE